MSAEESLQLEIQRERARCEALQTEITKLQREHDLFLNTVLDTVAAHDRRLRVWNGGRRWDPKRAPASLKTVMFDGDTDRAAHIVETACAKFFSKWSQQGYGRMAMRSNLLSAWPDSWQTIDDAITLAVSCIRRARQNYRNNCKRERERRAELAATIAAAVAAEESVEAAVEVNEHADATDESARVHLTGWSNIRDDALAAERQRRRLQKHEEDAPRIRKEWRPPLLETPWGPRCTDEVMAQALRDSFKDRRDLKSKPTPGSKNYNREPTAESKNYSGVPG